MATVLTAGAVVLAPLGAAVGADGPLRDPASEPGQTLDRTVLTKAEPDECFTGIGEAPAAINADGTCDVGQPKVNQAYVWGLAKAGDDLWFGTAPNVHCLVEQGYLGNNDPSQTNSYVCDPTTPNPYNTEQTIGNFRPPKIYRYDEATGVRHDIGATLTGAGANLLRTTLGIRSAGSAGGVVLMGGPSVVQGGINLFAFDADTDELLAARNVQAYSNIRKWVNVDGQLYTGVANNTRVDGVKAGGAVLRWLGDEEDPLGEGAFEVVGTLDGEGAELAEHQGRLFVATWPCCEQSGGLSGGGVKPAALWMSPVIGEDQTLTTDDADAWEQVWQATDYEPDPVTARVYGGGALASYGGYLYWGTMHVPGTALAAHRAVYGDSDSSSAQDQFVNTNRAITIFRGKDFGTDDETQQLVYGDATLPTYSEGHWIDAPNKMTGEEGIYGPSGFGNRFNNYTWTMDVLDGKLFVGTMDWSYLILDGIDSGGTINVGGVPMPPEAVKSLLLQQYPNMKAGADLWRFDSPNGPAKAESTQGVGNYLNYGVRTMIADNEADALYLGMADPMNLMTDPNDNRPEGGWELLKLTPRSGGGTGGGTGGGSGEVPETPSKVDRVYGPDRISTAIEASKDAYPAAGSAKAAVLTASNGYADALGGGPLAAETGGPLLLTKPGKLDPDVLTELQRVLGDGATVYVLGGTAALSSDVADALSDAGFAVRRLAGANRYATAVKVADAVGEDDTVFLASSQGFADALAAGPAAARTDGVVLQTNGRKMPKQTAAWLADHPDAKVYAVGGAAAKAKPSAQSFAGGTRYETATLVADRFFPSPTRLVIASGEAFADALSGGAIAATVGAPVVLTKRAEVPTESGTYLAGHHATVQSATIYGGTSAVSDAVMSAIERLLR